MVFRVFHSLIHFLPKSLILFLLSLATNVCFGQQEQTQAKDSIATQTALQFEGEITFEVGYEFHGRDSTKERGLNFGFTLCPYGFRLRGKLGFPVNHGVISNVIQSIDVGYTSSYHNFSWTPYISFTNVQPFLDNSRVNHLYLALGVDFDLFRGRSFSFRPGIRLDISSNFGFGIGAQFRFGRISPKS